LSDIFGRVNPRPWKLRIATTMLTVGAVVALFNFDRLTGHQISEFFGTVGLVLLPIGLLLAFVGAVYIAARLSPDAEVTADAAPPGDRERWVDEPVDLDEIDEYDRRPFVDRLQGLIRTAVTERSSSVIGLAGQWGTGKSSVLKTLTRRISEEASPETPLVAEVNPWRYGSTDALLLGVFSEIRAAMPTEARWSEARERLVELLEASAPFGTLTTPFGFDSSRAMNLTARRLGRSRATRAQTLANEALSKLRRPILVIVDDIDRLGPDELLSLFRAIRLLGRLPYVHYLLTLDSEVVADVLTRTGLVGKKAKAAHRYLEKMIQLRLDLPPIRRVDVDRVVGQAVERTLIGAGHELARDRQDEFAFIYNTQIAETLVSPRAVQRWLSHLSLTYPPLAADVDFVDFAVMTWLRLTYPGLPLALRAHKYAAVRTFDLASSLIKYDAAQRDGEWRVWLAQAGIPDDEIERVYAVLARIFPEIAKAKSRSVSDNWTSHEAALSRQGIGHADYFERYFALAVPREEISESSFIDQIEALTSVKRPPLDGTLSRTLLTSGGSVVQRVENWVNGHPRKRVPVIRWLAALYPLADHDDILSPQERIRGLLHRLVAAHPSLDEALRAILSVPGGLPTAALVLADLMRGSVKSSEVESARASISENIRVRLDRTARKPTDFDVSTRSLLWTWQAIDNPSARAWYQDKASQGWLLVEAVAVLVGTARLLGVRNAQNRLTGVEQSSIDAFLDRAWVEKRLRDPVEAAELRGERLKATAFNGLPDTWQNRLGVARDYLADIVSPEPK
jgi:hypothetical protein